MQLHRKNALGQSAKNNLLRCIASDHYQTPAEASALASQCKCRTVQKQPPLGHSSRQLQQSHARHTRTLANHVLRGEWPNGKCRPDAA